MARDCCETRPPSPPRGRRPAPHGFTWGSVRALVASVGRVALGVGEGWCVGGVEAGDEAVDLVVGPGDLREPAGDLLDLRPEVPHFLDRDAGVHEQAPQLVGRVGRGGLGGRLREPVDGGSTRATGTCSPTARCRRTTRTRRRWWCSARGSSSTGWADSGERLGGCSLGPRHSSYPVPGPTRFLVRHPHRSCPR